MTKNDHSFDSRVQCTRVEPISPSLIKAKEKIGDSGSPRSCQLGLVGDAEVLARQVVRDAVVPDAGDAPGVGVPGVAQEGLAAVARHQVNGLLATKTVVAVEVPALPVEQVRGVDGAAEHGAEDVEEDAPVALSLFEHLGRDLLDPEVALVGLQDGILLDHLRVLLPGDQLGVVHDRRVDLGARERHVVEGHQHLRRLAVLVQPEVRGAPVAVGRDRAFLDLETADQTADLDLEVDQVGHEERAELLDRQPQILGGRTGVREQAGHGDGGPVLIVLLEGAVAPHIVGVVADLDDQLRRQVLEPEAHVLTEVVEQPPPEVHLDPPGPERVHHHELEAELDAEEEVGPLQQLVERLAAEGLARTAEAGGLTVDGTVVIAEAGDRSHVVGQDGPEADRHQRVRVGLVRRVDVDVPVADPQDLALAVVAVLVARVFQDREGNGRTDDLLRVHDLPFGEPWGYPIPADWPREKFLPKSERYFPFGQPSFIHLLFCQDKRESFTFSFG